MGHGKRFYAELAAIALTMVLVCGCLFQRSQMIPGNFSMTSHVPDGGPVWQVNINTASPETLTALPGIGEALAERIVSYREENGPFAAPEELTRVSGIGEKTFANLKDYITVEDPF